MTFAAATRLVDEWLAYRLETSTLPGISVAIEHGDQRRVITHGFADVAERRPIVPTTQFNVASQTKVVSLLAVLRLYRAGALDLDVPLTTYLDEAVPAAAGVTLRDVLTHRTGFAHSFRTGHQDVLLSQAFADATPATRGGDSPAYSNLGFALIARVIETQAGCSYEAFTQQLWTDLGMTDTSWGGNTESAVGYGPEMGGIRYKISQPGEVQRGATGCWSTPSDLCRLLTAICVGPGSTADVATKVQWTHSFGGKPKSHALGLEVREMAAVAWLGHAGGTPGYISATYYCAERDTMVSAAANSRDPAVLGAVMETIAHASKEFSSKDDAPHARAEYLGRFWHESGPWEITFDSSGYLLIDPLAWDPLGSASRIEPAGRDCMRFVDAGFSDRNLLLRYLRDENGAVAGLELSGLRFDKVVDG